MEKSVISGLLLRLPCQGHCARTADVSPESQSQLFVTLLALYKQKQQTTIKTK